MNNKKHIKRIFASDFSRDAREGHLFKRDNLESSVCPYFENCNVAKISGRDCSYPSYKDCQTWKYYNKYGEQGNQIGVGS